MLKYAGFDLLNVGEWSYREGDKEWVENVSRTIRAYCENRGFDPSHAEKVIAEAHKPRIRPEEVMAGAILAPPQSTFVDCVALGEKILEYLRDIKRSTE